MAPTRTIALSVEIGLRMVGIWPNSPYALLYRCVWALTIGIIQVCQYWYIIINFGYKDLEHLMEGLSVTLEYTVMSSRLIILWFNTRILHDVIASMDIDWKDVTNSHMHIMISKANLSQCFSNLIVGLHAMAVALYGIGVFVAQTNSYVDNATEAPAREIILKMQLPFEYNDSPLYELVVGMQWLHQITSSAVTGSLNSLIVTLILHVSGQIDILCDALTKISFGRDNNRSAVSVIKDLIKKHKKIIVFANKIESIFCYIALIQFVASTSVICCLGYMIVTSISKMQASNSIDSSGLMKAVVFYLAILVEAFLFCFSGEYLSAKVGKHKIGNFKLDSHCRDTFVEIMILTSKMIGDAAYKSLWYDLKPNESRFFLFLILRSQRRLTITVGKIMDLSLEGFTTILKASVSYVSVLHAMS